MSRRPAPPSADDDASDGPATMRLDKWLWAARFYKTRALAVEQIERGRVRVDGHPVKVGRALKPGDTVSLLQGHDRREVVVEALDLIRGPAAAAQRMYRETDASVATREASARLRRLAPEPAAAIAAQRSGRPTKRDRRALASARDGWAQAGTEPAPPPDWQRWSASVDD